LSLKGEGGAKNCQRVKQTTNGSKKKREEERGGTKKTRGGASQRVGTRVKRRFTPTPHRCVGPGKKKGKKKGGRGKTTFSGGGNLYCVPAVIMMRE